MNPISLRKVRTLLGFIVLITVPNLSYQSMPSTHAQAGANSPPAMIGANPQRTRVYESVPMMEPKTLLWTSAKLFTTTRSYAMEVTPVGMGGMLPFSVPMTTGHGFTEPILAGNTIFFSLYINDAYVYAQDRDSGKDKWRFKLKDQVFSPLAIASDVLYFGASDGSFYALSVETGHELWKKAQKGKDFFTAAPLVADDAVFFSSTESSTDEKVRPDGRLFALNRKTGDQLWVFKVKGSLSAPALADKTVVVGDSEGVLHALDSETGLPRWQIKLSGGCRQPTIGDSAVYLLSTDGSLHAVDVQTGEEKWKTDKVTRSMNLMMESDAIYVRSEPNLVYAIDGPTGATNVALDKNTVYYGGEQNSVFAIDAGTGKPKWTYKTSKHCGSPVLAGGVVYFPSLEGVMYAVDAETGAEKWKLKSSSKVLSPPIIADGKLYFLGLDGHLYALK